MKQAGNIDGGGKRVKRLSSVAQLNRIVHRIMHLFSGGANDTDRLRELPNLFVPTFADWCCLHFMGDEGTFERAAIVPVEIEKLMGVYDWLQNDLANDEEDGLPAIRKDGKPRLVAHLNQARRGADAGIRSYIIVPLIRHKQVLGGLTLIIADEDRHYDAGSRAWAEVLSIFITACLDLSQPDNENQRINNELELRSGEKTIVLDETLAQLKQTEEVIQNLFRVSNKLNATLDVEQILDMLAQEAVQMVNGESGFAGLRTAEGMTVHKYYHNGTEIPFEHTWAPGDGIPGWVLKFKVPYGTSDAEHDPLLRHDLSINADVHTIICTPILDTVGEVIAYFDIRNKKGEEGFTIADQEMLLMLAPVASIAIQNALAYQQRLATVDELSASSKQLERLAVSLETAREDERMQVSRELHDELGQTLTAMKFDLSWLSDQLKSRDEVLAQKTMDLITQVNGLISTVRRMATELRPGMLEDLGLVASIEWQVRDFEKRSGIQCALQLPEDEPSLTQDQSLAIFRILQESLTNVSRYAHAKHVEVRLQKRAGILDLEIHDDGKGINEEEIHGQNSIGLIGMRERTKHMGGTFEIKGTPYHGTTLRVSIPIDNGDSTQKHEER